MIYPGFGIARNVSGGPVVTELIADRQAADVAQIDIAWTGDYDAVFMEVANVRPVTDGANFRMLTSSDGGSTFDSGVSDYRFRHNGFFASQTTTGGQAPYIDISAGVVGSDSFENCRFSLVLPLPFDAAEFTQVIGKGGTQGTGNNPASTQLYGQREAAARVDAVRFFFASGNISEGRFTASGLRRG